MLRNVSAEDGLVNGTRMIVTRIHDQNIAKWITCRVLKDYEVDLPMLFFRHKANANFPVEFSLIRVCFSMINLLCIIIDGLTNLKYHSGVVILTPQKVLVPRRTK